MNLNQHQSLRKLWSFSFSVANRALPRLLAVLVGWTLVCVAIIGCSFLLIKQALAAGSVSFSFVALAGFFFVVLLISLFSGFLYALCTHIVWDTTHENNRTPLSETLLDCLKATLPLFVAGLVVNLVPIPVRLAINFVGAATNPLIANVLSILAGIVLFLVFQIRMVYVSPLIVCRRVGPIDGLVESWRLTGKNYLDTLLMCLLLGFTAVLYGIIAAVLAGFLATFIPLHLANVFDLTQNYGGWIVLFLVGGLLLFFCITQTMCFLLVTYFNRDTALHNPFAQDPASVPLPDVDVTAFEGGQHVEEGLPPDANAVAAPAQPQQPARLDGLEVSSASVSAGEQDQNEITQHLKQVYTPQQDHAVQQGDEDRMPTILFDDVMAQELEQNTDKLNPAQHTPGPAKPEDDGPIKMSK